MAKALGVGGVFFKSSDPEALCGWYERWLGIPVEPSFCVGFQPATIPAGGYTVWAPFKSSTTYFEPSEKDFMINLMVDDLDGALDQVREGGASTPGEIAELDFGRFGWFVDPEGNKVELWEPKEYNPAPSTSRG